MKRLQPEEEAIAIHGLELSVPLMLTAIETCDTHSSRLAMRIALTLMLDRVSHPDDNEKAERIITCICEGLAE